MSSSLQDIMKGRNYGEPPEVKIIKDFVMSVIGVTPRVSVRNESFIITLPSAAAAGSLRVHVFRLQSKVGMNKRIILRIG